MQWVGQLIIICLVVSPVFIERREIMTGTLQSKKLNSGRRYFYVKLSYKDSKTGRWRCRTIATHLEDKNNKRKAESMIPQIINTYSYLELSSSTEIDKEILVEEYLDRWLEMKKSELRKTTYEIYCYRVRKIAHYFTGKKVKMAQMTPKMVDDFLRYCKADGKINQKTHEHGPMSVRSVRELKNIMSAMFTQAQIDGIVRFNPVLGIKIHGKRNADYSDDMLFLSEEEIAELLIFLSKNYPRLVGIAFFGAYYGLRRSEILGLRWDAIDHEKKTINIRRTVVRGKSIVEIDAVKTHSSRRTLNLFDTAENCLAKIKKEQDADKEFFGNEYKDSLGYIFTWEDGRLYDPSYISNIFSKATAKFGRPEITLHKLRHSCASMLINKGWDIKKLQYWLGHTDTATTLNIYSHFYRKRLNESYNDLSDISKDSAMLFA